MIHIRKRERKMAGKSLVLNTSGLVKICAFLVFCVHYYKVKRKHYNLSL